MHSSRKRASENFANLNDRISDCKRSERTKREHRLEKSADSLFQTIHYFHYLITQSQKIHYFTTPTLRAQRAPQPLLRLPSEALAALALLGIQAAHLLGRPHLLQIVF